MKRLLVANRGEIARRIQRSAAALGIETVAVYSDADARSLHVGEADASVALGGSAAADSYLRIDKLIAAARASGADAVHPGYGFLSENADFAQAVLDAGLAWVGPPPGAIRALGNKAALKQRAARLGVPCLPGYAGEDQSDARFAAEAERIGFPVMVKAAAGGGGRGMRLVQQPDELIVALRSARSEAASSFGSGELLLERALMAPRHVEVQVLADTHGNCLHLGERDCSVQRRHQKLIEESPSPVVDAALRERMGACAVRLAQDAGYAGAGTVEFLLEGGEFYLMEMNTRLQVEHPVTEAITGIDLVEWQLRVARGEALPLAQHAVRRQGHAIEVRLCAEDEQFAPHAGTVQRFAAPRGVRMDHALVEGAVVPPHYDSMLGKIVAHAPTRAQAIERLAHALDDTLVLGLPTNRALLRECLLDAAFGAGEAAIPFLAERGQALREAIARRESALRPLAFAALWCAAAPALARALAPPFERAMRLRHRGELVEARLVEQAPHGLQVRCGDRTLQVDTRRAPRELAVDGLSVRVDAVRRPDGAWHVQIDGADLLLTDASFDPPTAEPGALAEALRAPFSGRVIALHVAAGQRVSAGETLLVIESMKLEHAVSAVHDATVAEVPVCEGQQVAPQQVLLRFQSP
ncbi:MAG TPA: biotin carboxylase N-terminal domain-containing protein [Albitalea sp.]|nr:biotin carboxylase N-terminal domain-containing protein [Albitalea sp.]